MSDAENEEPAAAVNNALLDEDEEDECRVCRGPEEEGRPLYKPCKCSGSIGLTHQDCLQSWLEVQRSSSGGTCELCKTQFRFSPQYAPSAPEKLSAIQVLLGLARRIVARWLPLCLRILFAASLWLLVAPLITAYLYLGWMNRPSIILERLSWKLLTTDLVSGAVVAAYIIISFLSLMSFADFLRVEWQQRGLGPLMRGNNNNNGAGGNPGGDHRRGGVRDPDPVPQEEDIDNGIWLHVQQEILAQPRGLRAHHNEFLDLDENNTNNNEGSPNNNDAAAPSGDEFDDDDDDDDEDYTDGDASSDLAAMDDDDSHELAAGGDDDDDHAFLPRMDPDDDDDGGNYLDGDHHNEQIMPDLMPFAQAQREGPRAPANRNNNNNNAAAVAPGNRNNNNNNDAVAARAAAPPVENRAFDFHPEEDDEDVDLMPFAQAQREGPRAPVARNNNNNDAAPARAAAAPPVDNRAFDFDPEDNVDVDINIALDELLGVRGPLGAVVRNLLWLLAFNAVYVGFFCFVPRTVGTAVTSVFFNTSYIGATNGTMDSNETSLAGGGGISLGKIVSAIDTESERHQTVFRLHDLTTVTLGYLACAAAAWIGRLLWLMSQRIGFFNAQGRRTGHVEVNDMREAMDEMNRIVNGDLPPLGEDPPGVALNMAIGMALEAMMAIVKVGVLLFLKMFLLPILLGLCLDASVASVFGFNIEERIAYAGSDLFSFILLHWVCGITFMLLVTVSVLQLREVAHPDLLSQIIRPQEPQPDLLGNLMHETVGTHAKRMALSLVIYAVLWVMHVYIPARLLAASGVLEKLPFLELKLFYVITPKLQVPFELLFFHLCMLALLERYKNGLGEMQHHWLKLLTGIMGIRDCVLPMKVASFHYVGTRAVFQEERVVDPFWYDLAKGESSREMLLDNQFSEFRPVLTSPDAEPVIMEGITKPDGQRVLTARSDFIRLPYILPGRALRSRSTLLPTKIGKYRLQRGHHESENVIHLWAEDAGAPIPRPPEGWDDLGVDPPEVQGRWAYGNEKRSAIEGGVAWRRPFFGKDQGWISSFPVFLKLSLLFVLSWCATTLLLCAAVAVPPAVGRLLYFILRVPDKWVHDPLAFAFGFSLTLRPFAVFARMAVSSEEPLWRRFASWILRFRVPPTYKASVLFRTFVLWFGLAPLFFGTAYDIAFVKSTAWFLGEEPLLATKSLAMDWVTGTLLLYIWSFFCMRGVLTRRFRVFVVEGRELPEEENPANAQAAAWQNAGAGLVRLTWQGKHGRMARFWDVLNAVIINWEWDKVDPTILLHDVAMPVTKELFISMIVPTAAVECLLYCPYFSGLTRAILVRSLIAIVSLTQVANVWQDQLSKWFEFAHKSARDDLYLIGEVLMNYGE